MAFCVVMCRVGGQYAPTSAFDDVHLSFALMTILWLLHSAWFCFWLAWQWLVARRKLVPAHFSGRRCVVHARRTRHARKPDWVGREIIRLKAWMPEEGCRKIAATFNRLHAVKRCMIVSKSFVADWVRRHRYEIEDLRRTWKRRMPYPTPVNRIWGVDLTGKTDVDGELHAILGIVDHGSRRAITLTALRDKSSIFLLRCLLDAIERFGKPRFIRTDNESVFTSRLFAFGLRWLGIGHQLTDPGCPWMNGRIERLFGTLKGKLDQWMVTGIGELSAALGEFSVWYNHVRPHQHLGGQTPVEAWDGIDPYASAPRQVRYFSAWDGLLTGFYLRR